MYSPKDIYEWLERICFDTEDPKLMGYMQDVKTYIGAFEQIEWERDAAISQLRSLGYDLGQKIDIQKIYDDIYPLTVVMDRYSGTYSGGAFTAWNLDVCDVPYQICSGDNAVMAIFDDLKNGDMGIVYGAGPTPNAAVKDLWNKLKKNDKYNGSEEHDTIGTTDASEFHDCREDMTCYNEHFCECRDCDECSFHDTV